MFGQLVIGAPGVGKTTFCDAVSQFFDAIERKHCLVNLDPACDPLPYKPEIDIRELIAVDDVMEELNLGPNGAMVYCFEFLEKNVEWLVDQIREKGKDRFLIFDCPGQVELYTHYSTFQAIVEALERELDLRVVIVHLVEIRHCADASSIIAMSVMCQQMMLRMSFPFVNVLNKLDTVQKLKMKLLLDFRSHLIGGGHSLQYLLPALDSDPRFQRLRKLNTADAFSVRCVVDLFGLIAIVDMLEDLPDPTFTPLYVEDKALIFALLQICDKANGYEFAPQSEERRAMDILKIEFDSLDFIDSVKEKYMYGENDDEEAAEDEQRELQELLAEQDEDSADENEN